MEALYCAFVVFCVALFSSGLKADRESELHYDC